jgi:hypothetical protein
MPALRLLQERRKVHAKTWPRGHWRLTATILIVFGHYVRRADYLEAASCGERRWLGEMRSCLGGLVGRSAR